MIVNDTPKLNEICAVLTKTIDGIGPIATSLSPKICKNVWTKLTFRVCFGCMGASCACVLEHAQKRIFLTL